MEIQNRLSVSELLLLNILLYFSEMNGLCFEREDRDGIFRAIQNNPLLTSIQLISVTSIPDEGAVCAAFLSRGSDSREGGTWKELIVAFRGTSEGEWLDNFIGGAETEAPDRVSTKQQMRALNWYRTLPISECYVTVTGHSKGGNKAKYIAIREDSVDRCVSFNGQGFSEEFVFRYKERIIMRQGIVENHNTEYDYVNWLLHDFGKTYFYKNQMPGKGFLAGHCPNAILQIDESGHCLMECVGYEQPDKIRKLDRTLNFLLHALPERYKIELMEWIGTCVQMAMDEKILIKEIFKEISQIFQTLKR